MSPRSNPYDVGLDKNPANYASLTPIDFIAWSARVCPNRVAVIHGERRFSWAETYARSRRLASALAGIGITVGDTVAALLSNTPEHYEAHFGVPMTGAVLNALNTRLDARAIAFMLEHGEAKVLLVDREFSALATAALGMIERAPLVIGVDDPVYDGDGELLGVEYEAFLSRGDPEYEWQPPSDEWNAIALSYTSGTTGDPKGVVTHHRGAYLNAIGNVLAWNMQRYPVYLWTLPMFHCNGWCFPWSIAAQSGTNVCLRKVEPATIFRLMKEHQVTHYCGAPVVHNTLVSAPAELREGLTHHIHAMVAGASPPSSMIEGLERINIELTHTYGLTEVYGPSAACTKQEEWESLSPNEIAMRNGRQGVPYVLQGDAAVLDPVGMERVPADGETMGEIMFRGNIVMKGYLKNPAATQKAFAGGWFHSGDLAVTHADGYMKIKDRAKDIIISGGENISSLEVEEVLFRHKAVFAAAVVAQPDEKWGETPIAFVELRPGVSVSDDEIIAHCYEQLARFKVPKTIVFGALPRTSTGKVQKFILRERAKSAEAIV
jgi:3-(methylthio)propionyl---CoA ligase